ncbi:Nitrous oxide reductase maturation transmembrane protein NosY [hydrothermal vent metagenome]|uniref:Nitrous oxide reductase maturation transmembrane protein NosY n=1 Tax=hydrothermal vent metagenome TaxID=652676 RepID=A0A3B0VQP2_9ZZZZ
MNIYYILSRELRNSLANRYLIAMIVILAALGLTLVSIGSSTTGELAVDRLTVQVASLSGLSIFLVPLIALFISYDSVVGEKEQGRLILELSYPISRFEWLLGKFLGHWLAVIIAIFIGYIIAIIPILFSSQLNATSLISFVRLIYSSILLGGIFIAIGYIISVLVKQRSSAAGIAIGLWLVFVMLFDLALLGLLVSDTGKGLSASQVNALLMANPIDVFRLMSLSTEQVNQFSAMQAIGEVNSLSFGLLSLVMIAWLLVPLIISILLFRRVKL